MMKKVVIGLILALSALLAITLSASAAPQHSKSANTGPFEGKFKKLSLDGHISADGDDLKANAKIDLPWLCGRDPVISGTLFKSA